MGQEKLYMGQESLFGWDRRKWLDGTGEVVYGSGEFDRMGQEKLIWWDKRSWYYIKTRRFFWQQMSYFYSWEDNCYQNCKVIVKKNLRWNYHLAMDEKWPSYQGMAARYWMSHQYHLAFYFWCIAEDINHEVFCSLLESHHSCALHLQVTLSKLQCSLLYKLLEGGFPDEEICCFLELTDLPCCHHSWVSAVRLSHGNRLLHGQLCSLCD